MTAFSVIEAEVIRAIERYTVAEAWANLLELYRGYQSLPGWDQSKEWLKGPIANAVYDLLERGQAAASPSAAAAAGPAQPTSARERDLENAANALIALRNQIAHTAVPHATGGAGEANHLGNLKYWETLVNNNNPKRDQINRNDVFEAVWGLFAQARWKNMSNEENQWLILDQHVETILSAYHRLFSFLGISHAELYASIPQ